MKAEDATKLATSALEQLAQALAAGHSDALTEYLAAAGRKQAPRQGAFGSFCFSARIGSKRSPIFSTRCKT